MEVHSTGSEVTNTVCHREAMIPKNVCWSACIGATA